MAFSGPQQPIAASGEPSCIDYFAMRFDTGLSDRREIRGSSDERWTPRQTGLFIPPPEVLECPDFRARLPRVPRSGPAPREGHPGRGSLKIHTYDSFFPKRSVEF